MLLLADHLTAFGFLGHSRSRPLCVCRSAGCPPVRHRAGVPARATFAESQITVRSARGFPEHRSPRSLSPENGSAGEPKRALSSRTGVIQRATHRRRESALDAHKRSCSPQAALVASSHDACEWLQLVRAWHLEIASVLCTSAHLMCCHGSWKVRQRSKN